MTLSVEEQITGEGNSSFKSKFVRTLQETTHGIPHPKLLDFGAGLTVKPQIFRQMGIPDNATTPFSDLQNGQETFAYNPTLLHDSDYETHDHKGVTHWRKELPPPQHINIVVGNFSLSHAGEPFDVVIRRLIEMYGPDIMAFSDYNYPKSYTVFDLKSDLRENSEIEELFKQFRQNWQAYLDYHRQFGKNGVEDTLKRNGFDIIEPNGSGEGKNKFYTIAHASNHNL